MRQIQQAVEPATLDLASAAGLMGGRSERYEKRLEDLSGVYRDVEAFEAALAVDDGSPVYWVDSSTLARGSGGLIIGVSSLRPGRVGEEFAMTRGHLHAKPECEELYYGLSGCGVMLLDSLDGRSRALPISPGVAVHVPGGWIHRSVNVGSELLTTLFCYRSDAGQNYDIIARAGGMLTLVVPDGTGWTTKENRDHHGYRA